MSKNLLKAGFALTVWNRTASKMEELVALGANSFPYPFFPSNSINR
jgi:3-hydroxyisobutyrate dehydrogenase-like beta-hydroxyacid dehydrogenase